MAPASLDLGDQVAPAEAARAEPGHVREQRRALDLADVGERAGPAEHVARERPAVRPPHVLRVAAGGAEPEAGPAGVQRAGARAGRGAEAAVLVLRLGEVARGALSRRGGDGGGREEQHEGDRDRAEHHRGGRALPAHLEAAAVARERAQEGRPDQEAEHDVAHCVGDVVRQRGPGHSHICIEILSGGECPLIHVHPRAERETGQTAESGEHEPVRLAAAKRAREHGARDAHGAPSGHLPDGPRALRQEDVRDDRRDRADREPRHGAECVAREQDDVGGGLDVRDRGEREPADDGERRERGHDRDTRAGGRSRSYQAKPPASASGEEAERGGLPAHRRASARDSERPALRHAALAQDLRALLRQECRAVCYAGHLGREMSASSEHLFGRPVGDHDALPEQHDPVGKRGGELGVMRRDHHRRAALRELAGSAPRARPCGSGPCPRVGSSRRTTAAAVAAEHHLQGEALALAAGQVARVRLLTAGQPGGGHSGHPGVLDGVPVDQVVARVLQQESDLTRTLDPPARRLLEPLRDPEHRALPGAVPAHQRDPLPGLEPQRDAAQDRGSVLDLVPHLLQHERGLSVSTVTTQ